MLTKYAYITITADYTKHNIMIVVMTMPITNTAIIRSSGISR